MTEPAPLDLAVRDQLRPMLSGDAVTPQALYGAFRLLAKWRQHHLDAELFQTLQGRIIGGPFAGMAYISRASHGSHAPKFIGAYETELAATIETIIATPYARILNIGCAEGYYAVGLARRMTGTTVMAYDADPNGRATCAVVAQANGVADRVVVGGMFGPGDFAAFTGERTLVFCDIEGAEWELLDLDAAPALRNMDILVECHDCFRPGLSTALASRFRDSHDVELIAARPLERVLPPFLAGLPDLDQFIATWEWRQGPTPWLWLTARDRQAQPGAEAQAGASE